MTESAMKKWEAEYSYTDRKRVAYYLLTLKDDTALVVSPVSRDRAEGWEWCWRNPTVTQIGPKGEPFTRLGIMRASGYAKSAQGAKAAGERAAKERGVL